MSSKEQQVSFSPTTTQKLDAIKELKSLTDRFRSSLKVYTDSNRKPKTVIIDGEENKLFRASADDVIKYAKAYTKIWNAEEDVMKQEMEYHWFIDCRNLMIEGPITSNTHMEWAHVLFNGSIISYFDFSENIFLGNASFQHVEFSETVDFSSAEFNKIANFSFAKFSKSAIFHKSKFMDIATFQRLQAVNGYINFSRAKFKKAPLFHETKLPQGVRFNGAIFDLDFATLSRDQLLAESTAFRTLKQAASNYRGQQDEAEFFALEQRTRRKGLLAPHIEWKSDYSHLNNSHFISLIRTHIKMHDQWTVRARPLEWAISLLYDWVSGYGRAPGKALLSFVLLNTTLTALYHFGFKFGQCKLITVSYCIHSGAESIFAKSNPAMQLTLQNLLNPSGLATEKSIITISNPMLIGISVLQSALSFLTLFLAALAIRTQFQKGGGGGS